MKSALSFFIAAVLFCMMITSVISASPLPLTGQYTKEHIDQNTSAKSRFLLFLPEGYGEDDRKWPVIVYLHGASVRGSNLSRVKRYGLPWLVETRRDFPFIVISPQCPAGKRWVDIDPNRVLDVLDAVCSEYAVDVNRIYLTGVSMGGHGAWFLAHRYPGRFAAVAPLCGRADTAWVETLIGMPAWVFHGEYDRVCPKRYSDRMVAALDSLGAEVKYTLYRGAGHDIVTRTYKNEELYEWFLLHRREESEFTAR